MNDDLILQQRVADELAFEPSVNAAHLGISVREGVVSLTGHLDSYAEKFAAERAVRRVKGVKALVQELEVRLPSDRKTGDDEIAARALKILQWDTLVPPDRIAIKVERGVVILSGEVEWRYQRAAAEDDVCKISGVKDVINDILVKPRVTADDVRAKIRAALERHADVEAQTVGVTVTGGKVALSGKVTAWTELDAIERAAWSAPGVTQVENRIEISRP
jgi:osmotically-inducible protein OsmY